MVLTNKKAPPSRKRQGFIKTVYKAISGFRRKPALYSSNIGDVNEFVYIYWERKAVSTKFHGSRYKRINICIY